MADSSVICVFSNKGGSGKTTLAVHLALAWSQLAPTALPLRRSAKSVRDYSAKIDQLGYTISRTIANMICAVVNSCSRSPITTDLPRVRPRLMILGNDGLPVADLGGSLGA